MIYYVHSHWLNMREEPDPSSKNIITAIPYGQEVRKMTEHDDWWFAGTYHQNQYVEGFVHSSYLTAGYSRVPNLLLPNIPEVHMRQCQARIQSDAMDRTYSINSNDRPVRNVTSSNTRKQSIWSIMDYLDVENSERYQANSLLNYSSVYAHDYAHLCGCYLPRVWWTDAGMLAFIQEQDTPVRYGITIREMNDNLLYEWLYHWGRQFGWNQVFHLNLLQEAANEGKVCLISAQGQHQDASGHICLVIPETPDFKAVRKQDLVCIPLMSQAGKENHKTFSNRWWTRDEYGFFGFWVHD